MCTGITVWRLNFVFPLMISDGFVWDANRMVAELRLLRASDFERYKKVRNLLHKPENSEHFGKPHPFRSLDLKSPEISRVFAFPASQSSLVSRAE